MILSYCRVSTDEQAANGTTSLAEQERKNKAVAMYRGVVKPHDFVTYTDSGVSGSVPLKDRPEGARMLADARKGDIIVAAKLDRIFRSASDALTTVEVLHKRGVDLILSDIGMDPVTSNGSAKLFFGMLSCFAEFERTRIAERMQDAKRAKKANGGHVGGEAPYGWQIVGHKRESRLEPVEAEQEVIKKVTTLMRQGRYHPYKICKELEREGIFTRTGKRFEVNQLKRIVAHELQRKREARAANG